MLRTFGGKQVSRLCELDSFEVKMWTYVDFCLLEAMVAFSGKVLVRPDTSQNNRSLRLSSLHVVSRRSTSFRLLRLVRRSFPLTVLL